jgi:hypothetical protein
MADLPTGTVAFLLTDIEGGGRAPGTASGRAYEGRKGPSVLSQR